ncbi:MAG: type I methionyl aminopeptidase [Chloroherpetonaceae bacterium]|nr:type I methionyl aminopeptidase [Chloroherpetonaceae bacterium]MCS7211236.1 type I methionyl aminopeptidase [Chloroherpetonaceae bacterium]MDW8018970.1 type I methionyl aminopeptidase [Chloroherpetonaceae bacterium]MDW8464891.1 type I methionyl aminopeptidase [Chloroherpetonaceae bacterium]
MVTARSEWEIDIMREAGRIVAETLDMLEAEIKEGVTTKRLDELAEDYIRSQGAKPSFLGYVPKGARNTRPYPATLCTSINEEVVHGIPSPKRVLKDGDIISIDCGACKDGYHADSARTFLVGNVKPEVVKLVKVTETCLELGIKEAVVGKRLYDISAAIQQYAESFGYGVIENMVGHGIGTRLHEEPPVPNIGKRNTGVFLREGMCLAIEPMINLGKSRKSIIAADTWTAITSDKKPAAHFEHTVVVRKGQAEILTLSRKHKSAVEEAAEKKVETI